MSNFTKPIDLRTIGKYKWELLTELSFFTDNKKTITVHRGFKTDLASVPRWAWSFIPPFGDYTKAAILHDYLYHTAKVSRKEADDIFKQAMKVSGVETWKRHVLYYSVRLFGKASYKG